MGIYPWKIPWKKKTADKRSFHVEAHSFFFGGGGRSFNWTFLKIRSNDLPHFFTIAMFRPLLIPRTLPLPPKKLVARTLCHQSWTCPRFLNMESALDSKLCLFVSVIFFLQSFTNMFLNFQYNIPQNILYPLGNTATMLKQDFGHNLAKTNSLQNLQDVSRCRFESHPRSLHWDDIFKLST